MYAGNVGDGEGAEAMTDRNYCDCAQRQRAIIGDGAFSGSDTQRVATIREGRGAGITLARNAQVARFAVFRAKQIACLGDKRSQKMQF